jgi:regulator of protease activity HflC (stomatin/prohibitin superfamily)
MISMESTSEILTGIAVELGLLVLVLGTVFRLLSGKFFVPSRMVILPNQRGVIVQGDRIIRVAEPGTCWVRPNQRVVLCDMRIRSLNMVGVEILSSDSGIVRLSISGKFRIADPSVYYTISTQANDALYVEVRKSILIVAKEMTSAHIVAVPELVATRLLEAVSPEAAKLGFEIKSIQIWESTSLGWLRSVQSSIPDAGEGSQDLVH